MIRRLGHRALRTADRLVHPGGRGIILLYHRIAADTCDPYGLCVSPAAFEEHLQAIGAAGRPLSAGAFADAVGRNALPDRSICITFDDGYADNVEVAEPLLARYDVPATIFVTTGRAGRDREFWWDELERIFLDTPQLPATLDLDLGATTLRRVIDTAAGPDRPAPVRSPGWRLLDPVAPSPRHAAFRQAYEALQPLPPDERDRAIDALATWAASDRSVRPARRAMDPGEVAALDRRGRVEIGAHTVTHPALPSQPPHLQRGEIERSKRDLEAWTGHEVAGFAYPYGLYDDSAVAAVRGAGFRYACSCIFRHVRPGSDVFLLPRIDAPAGDGDAVARLLRRQLA